MIRRGFTLIEMLLVLTILSIIASIVLPMALASSAGLADSTARLLWSDLEHAQVLAIARPNTRVALQVDADGLGWRLVDLDAPGTPLLDAIDDGYNARSLAVRFGHGRGAAYQDTTVGPAGRAIVFDALGGLEIPGGPDQTLTVTGPLTTRIVVVNPDTGFVSVLSP